MKGAVTIPKQLTHGAELVVVRRDEYDASNGTSPKCRTR